LNVRSGVPFAFDATCLAATHLIRQLLDGSGSLCAQLLVGKLSLLVFEHFGITAEKVAEAALSRLSKETMMARGAIGEMDHRLLSASQCPSCHADNSAECALSATVNQFVRRDNAVAAG